MNQEDFDNLGPGDVIRNASGEGWIVHANYGKYGVVLARTLLAHNPPEWTVIEKSYYRHNVTEEEL